MKNQLRRALAPAISLIAMLLMAVAPHLSSAAQAQEVINCVTGSSACVSSHQVGNGLQGDPNWKYNGKTNENFATVFGAWGSMSSFLATGVLTWADEVSFVTGTIDDSHCPSMAGHSVACAGGSGGLSSVGLSTTAPWLTAGSTPLISNGVITLNPTAGMTANQFIASPNGTTGAVSLRSIVPADVPTLNQNTTGNAATATSATSATSATTATTATNIAGGAANDLVEQTGAGATGFVVPSIGYLNWTGSAWAFSSPGGAGTVTGVTTSMPSPLTGGACSGSGALTCTVTWTAGQTANQVLASPNGTTGAVALRALVAADIPTLNQNTTGNAATATSATSAGSATTATTANNIAGGTANQIPVQTGVGATGYITGASSGYLHYNGTTFVYDTPGGAGTVTGVTTSMPSPLTGGACTGSGALTCTVTWTTGQTANQVLATPNGSTGAVGLRALVAADIPTISLSTGVSGALQAAQEPAHTGDMTNSATSLATTVHGYNGVSMAGLATGIVKNTTTTGVPSIAVAADFPTLNQSTTGNAATASAMAATGLTGTLQAAQEPAHTGDMTNTAGNLATTVHGYNGTSMAGLATGIVKNTTTTGVPSIAVAADFPTLNQSTTGNAATASAMATTGLTGALQAAQEPAHTGDVTNTAGSLGLTIAASAVTLSKQANFAASSLQGNPTGSPAAPSAITLGAGLSFSGTTLVASGGSATAITPGTTTIVGATAPCVIENSTSTTMGCASLASNLAIVSGVLGTTQPINAQTGTTYAMQTTDAGKLVTFSNASSIAATIVVATTSGFTGGYSADLQNLGVGTVTLTATTSTINGASTLVLKTGEGCTITSDGTNYQVSACTAATPAVNLAGTGHNGITGTLPAASLPAALANSTSVNGTTICSSCTLTQTIASGTSALGTGAITSGACATVVTTTATGTATTDVVSVGFNGDPTAVTGYVPSTSGMLTIIPYPSANNVNFKVCNNTASSITPGAITMNWRVVR